MLPSILDIAKDHKLIFNPKAYGKKETLCKCPFCEEDTKPAKRKKYYLSLNTEIQVFQCWFCKESGGVFRFISLLEGVPERDVVDRYRKKKGCTYQLHPAEKLTSQQFKLLRLEKPDWVDIRRFDYQSYKKLRILVWKAWKQFVGNEKRFSYQLLVAGIESGRYQYVIEKIQKREKEIGVSLLQDVLKLYSLQERPEQLIELEGFALHVCNPKKYPYPFTEKEEGLLEL